MIPSKRLELNVLTFPPLCGMLRRSRCVQSFPYTTLFSTTDFDITINITVVHYFENCVFKNQLLYRGERLPVQRRLSTHHLAAILELRSSVAEVNL